MYSECSYWPLPGHRTWELGKFGQVRLGQVRLGQVAFILYHAYSASLYTARRKVCSAVRKVMQCGKHRTVVWQGMACGVERKGLYCNKEVTVVW